MCKHWECPYNGCKYHEFFNEQNTRNTNNVLTNYFPNSEEEKEDCTLYLDV